MPPASLADLIENLVFEHYPFICNWKLDPFPPSVTALVDLHADLALMMLRIETTLARHGHEIMRPIKSPSVEVTTGHSALGERVTYKTECDHHLVDIDERREHLICRTCHSAVSPMWWLARFTKEVARAGEARFHLRKENDKLRAELEELKKERSKHKAAIRRRKT